MNEKELKKILVKEWITHMELIDGKKYAHLFPLPDKIHTLLNENFVLYNKRYLCNVQNLQNWLTWEYVDVTYVADISE